MLKLWEGGWYGEKVRVIAAAANLIGAAGRIAAVQFKVTGSSFDPPMFQRISMAKNVLQVQKALVISGIVYLFLV